MCISLKDHVEKENFSKAAQKYREQNQPVKAWKFVVKVDDKIQSFFRVGRGYTWREGLNVSSRAVNCLTAYEKLDYRTSEGFYCFVNKEDAEQFLLSFERILWDDWFSAETPIETKLMEVEIDPSDIVGVGRWGWCNSETILATKVTAHLPKE